MEVNNDHGIGNEKDEISRKFEQLLDSSRVTNSSFEVNSHELHQEILGFILDSVKIGNVLEELSQDVMPSKDLTQMTEDGLVEYFQSIAKSTNTPVSLVTSQILAQHLSEVTQQQNEQKSNQAVHHFLPHEMKQKVKVLLEIIRKINEERTDIFDKVIFVRNLFREDIPLEFVWFLHDNSVVSFRTCFLSWCDDEKWLKMFYESIASFCCDGDEDNIVLRETMLQDFIGDLLVLGYGKESESKDVVEKYRQILFKCVTYFEERTERLVSEQMRKWLCLYKVIRELKDVPLDVIQNFFQELLSILFAKPSTMKLENAFACQDKWTFEFLSEATRTKSEQFVLVFRNEELMQAIQHSSYSIKSEAVNIKVLCHLLTVFLIQNEDAYRLFDDFFRQCLSECFENCDMQQFHLVLLLRRQASLEGTDISPSYSTWFEQTFITKGSSLGLSTKKGIHFFFKSLTELVPYDKPEFLKVHIIKCPQIPSKFKYYADDYISLAKTRLQDLNISLEDNTALFTQSSSNKEQLKIMEQAREDVEKCLSLYEKSGKIPTTIMEASIFRKPYFVGRFLPALLVPRNLPREGDVRTCLIDDLNRTGKIPAGMFRSYQRKCEEFDDLSNDDKPRDNIQQLTHSLEKIPNLLVDMVTEADVMKDLQSLLSRISRKIKSIFGTSSQESTAEAIDLDALALNINKDCLQASYAIINVFCRACAAVHSACFSEEIHSNRAISKLNWASKFISILVSFPRLIQCLYVHLWSSLSREPHFLTQEHIHGLAILVCHLSCFKKSYSICQRSITETENDVHETFVDFISSQISLSSRSSAKFFLRWSCYYLQYAMVIFSKLTTDVNELSNDVSPPGVAYVPKTMLVKMEYLNNKLRFKTEVFDGASFLEKNEMKILDLVMQSIKKNDSLNPYLNITSKQWLTWELNTHEDILLENERTQYYYWIIYEYFLPLKKKDEYFSEFTEITTEITSTLLDQWTSSHESKANNNCPTTEISLVKILQNIVSLIGPNFLSQKTSNKIWLLDLFITRLDKIGKSESSSNEIQLRCEVLAFIKLATQLPAWLLVSNSNEEWATLNKQRTQKLSDFLNKYLKPNLFPTYLILPFNFTSHVLKLFLKNLKVKDENLSSANPEESFRRFVSNTPFMFASFIYFWKELKPFYYRYLPSRKSLEHLQSYHSWLSNIFTTTEQTSEYNCVPEDPIYNEVGNSYAIFIHIFKSLQNDILKNEDYKQRLENLLNRLLMVKLGKRTIIYLYDNIVGYLTSNIFQEDEIRMHLKLWYEMATAMLLRCPDVLCVFMQELNQYSELLSTRSVLFEGKILRFLPVIFFRIVSRRERSILQSKLPAETFTQAVLLMHIQCSDLYQNCSDNTIPSSQPLDLDTFVKITVFVKDYLSQTRLTVLQRIPEFVVMKLPKEIQRYVLR